MGAGACPRPGRSPARRPRPSSAGHRERLDRLGLLSEAPVRAPRALAYLFQGVGSVIGFHRVVGPRLMGLKPDESAIAVAMPRARVVFRELSRLLGPQPYFAGETISLADFLVAPQLDLLAQTPEWATLTTDTPNLVPWLERMNERASMKATTWERVAEMARAA